MMKMLTLLMCYFIDELLVKLWQSIVEETGHYRYLFKSVYLVPGF